MDLSLIGFLGPFVIGAVIGVLFLRMDSQKRTARGGSPIVLNDTSETFDLTNDGPSFQDNVVKSSGLDVLMETPPSLTTHGNHDGDAKEDHRSDHSKCPCGLVLPEVSMWEHVMSTGHSGISSAASVKLAKIWELEEAMIEQTSPDCYKCGKPVQGLKRVGKTIYVTHVGCMNPAKPEEAGEISGKVTEVPDRQVGSRKSEKCPICWEPVSANDFVEVMSSTGNRTKFHDNCLN